MKCKKIFKMLVGLFIVAMAVSSFSMKAQNTIEDDNVSVFSIGDSGENILVRGRTETVGDFGDVFGYEITSSAGTSCIEYRDSVHHSMIVTTSEGETEGYCMQAYMNGPSTDSYTDYNYVEGLKNSTIFSALSDQEKEKWKTVYVVATKYGYGGKKADPNFFEGTNVQDGGTYGTYIVQSGDSIKAVKGLMIGGKVYEMTPDEARALTQVIVHYVGNRDSQYNITDFKGFTNPDQTSKAFAHLKAYADCAKDEFDVENSLEKVAVKFDALEATKPYQAVKWYIFDYAQNKWVDYIEGEINENHISGDKKINIKVEYYSKNICNKLVVNSNVKDRVSHSYEPFVVSSIDQNANYYDYFTVVSSSKIPIEVNYNKIVSGKEKIQNSLLDNMSYDIEIFSQSAIVEIDAEALEKLKSSVVLEMYTGEGAAAENCFNQSMGKYCTRMYSCETVQDCLLLASNADTRIQASVSVDLTMTGSMTLDKVSGRSDITDGNPCYDFSGATYNVYNVVSDSDDDKDRLVGTFQTNQAGKGIVIYSLYNQADVSADGSDNSKTILTGLPLGWYMVCEESGPYDGSYQLDAQKYYVEITIDNYKIVANVKSEEYPVADPIPFEVIKQCAEGENVGNATLEGAEFTVWYYKGEYDSWEDIKASGVDYERRWMFKTQTATTTNNATCIIHKDLLLEGSDEPFLKDDKMILPLGTIVIAETKAPAGYKLDGVTYNLVNTIDGTKIPIEGPYVSKVEVNQGTVRLSAGNTVIVDEEPVRGDLKLVKKDKHTGEPMAGIPFLITSATTGESHVIVTDENGVASTASGHISHSTNTNGNDSFDENDVLYSTGVWFLGKKVEEWPDDVEIDDSKGALPYDTYVIKELNCQANKDYFLSDVFEINISEDGMVFEYGEIYNQHHIVIGTEAFDATDDDKIITLGSPASVNDIVSYEYVEIGKAYILKGVLVDKSTGNPIIYNDKTVETSVEFKPTEEKGFVKVPFEFQLTDYDGGKLVVFEYLYDKESGELLASHEDIECEKQTLTVISATVKNEIKPPEVSVSIIEEPKTGDGANLGIVMGGMIISVILIIGIVYKKKHI